MNFCQGYYRITHQNISLYSLGKSSSRGRASRLVSNTAKRHYRLMDNTNTAISCSFNPIINSNLSHRLMNLSKSSLIIVQEAYTAITIQPRQNSLRAILKTPSKSVKTSFKIASKLSLKDQYPNKFWSWWAKLTWNWIVIRKQSLTWKNVSSRKQQKASLKESHFFLLILEKNRKP
jgi:hypothetical protein